MTNDVHLHGLIAAARKETYLSKAKSSRESPMLYVVVLSALSTIVMQDEEEVYSRHVYPYIYLT